MYLMYGSEHWSVSWKYKFICIAYLLCEICDEWWQCICMTVGDIEKVIHTDHSKLWRVFMRNDAKKNGILANVLNPFLSEIQNRVCLDSCYSFFVFRELCTGSSLSEVQEVVNSSEYTVPSVFWFLSMRLMLK